MILSGGKSARFMPLELKCVCNGCHKQQTLTVTRSASLQELLCPQCGAVLLEMRTVPGYVYILSNPSFPGLLKIGITTRSVADRAAELSAATGVPAAFTVEAYFESSDPAAHESAVHGALDHARVKGKEFFRVTVEDAINAVRKVTGGVELGDSPQSYADRWAQKAREEADRVVSHPRFRCDYCQSAFSSASNICPKCQRGAPRLWR